MVTLPVEQNPAQALVRRLRSRVRDAQMRYGLSIAARAEMRREQRTPSDPDLPIDRYDRRVPGVDRARAGQFTVSGRRSGTSLLSGHRLGRIGLAAGVSHFGSAYRDSMIAAADWLVQTQDDDGCWRKHATPYAKPGEKAYETHVAWGLFEAARLELGRGYPEAATKNLEWALSHQSDNRWFSHCCLTDPRNPLTHTIGYALRGLIEGYQFTRDGKILAADIVEVRDRELRSEFERCRSRINEAV